MSKQEQKIKTYLHHIGNEDYCSSINNFQARYTYSKQFYSTSSQFSELTDWSNQKIIQSTDLPPVPENKTSQIRKRIKEMDLTSYRSSLFRTDEKKVQTGEFLSPVILRFSSTQLPKQKNKKSHLLYQKMLQKENGKKIQQPQKLRSLLDRMSHSQASRYSPEKSLPRTERCSGILRMLKKRQKIKSIVRQRVENPEDIKAFKIH